MRSLNLISLATTATLISGAAMSAETINVPQFRSIQLRDGGEVTLRSGAAQSVSLVEGDTRFTHFTVDREGQLLIATTCNRACPRNYRIRIVVTSPHLDGAAVDEGGSIVAQGAFPAQDSIGAAVNEGGHVDVRAIRAGIVHAAVNEGGNIKVTATDRVVAAVNGGGVIQYWGNPSSVRRAIANGGVIAPGGTVQDTQVSAAAPVPPVPPVPPVSGVRVSHDSPDDYDDSDMDDDEDADDATDSDDDAYYGKDDSDDDDDN